jgi:hypothetical protein
MIKKIPADSKTFHVLNYGFAQDNNHVFLFGGIITNCPPTDFHLYQPIKPVIQSLYYRCGEKVFYWYAEIPEADPNSFIVLNQRYAKDKNSAYLIQFPIKYSDPNTFTLLEHDYSKDKLNVYHGGTLIPGADPSSFTPLGNYYSKDQNHVYYFSRLLEDANPKTTYIFRYNGDGFDNYALDEAVLYSGNEKISKIDTRTYILLSAEKRLANIVEVTN